MRWDVVNSFEFSSGGLLLVGSSSQEVSREGQGKRQEDVQLVPGGSPQGQAAGDLQGGPEAQASAGLSCVVVHSERKVQRAAFEFRRLCPGIQELNSAPYRRY